MTPLWVVLVAIAQALGWLSLPPRSLQAAAEREAIRRRFIGPSVGSYRNDTLASDRVTMLEAAPASTVLEVAEQVESAANVRGESWWRQRVAAIKAAIAVGEREILALQSEIARLEGQAISRDDPAQQALLRNEGNDARAELEKRHTGVVAARRELEALFEEARRLDVPPGWLR
jgi:hypothetical protein